MPATIFYPKPATDLFKMLEARGAPLISAFFALEASDRAALQFNMILEQTTFSTSGTFQPFEAASEDGFVLEVIDAGSLIKEKIKPVQPHLLVKATEACDRDPTEDTAAVMLSELEAQGKFYDVGDKMQDIFDHGSAASAASSAPAPPEESQESLTDQFAIMGTPPPRHGGHYFSGTNKVDRVEFNVLQELMTTLRLTHHAVKVHVSINHVEGCELQTCPTPITKWDITATELWTSTAAQVTTGGPINAFFLLICPIDRAEAEPQDLECFNDEHWCAVQADAIGQPEVTANVIMSILRGVEERAMTEAMADTFIEQQDATISAHQNTISALQTTLAQQQPTVVSVVSKLQTKLAQQQHTATSMTKLAQQQQIIMSELQTKLAQQQQQTATSELQTCLTVSVNEDTENIHDHEVQNGLVQSIRNLLARLRPCVFWHSLS